MRRGQTRVVDEEFLQRKETTAKEIPLNKNNLWASETERLPALRLLIEIFSERNQKEAT
jgi:hypothetical protein